MNHSGRNKVWGELTHRWLPLVFKALAEHAIRVGAGERGVLCVTVNVDDMEAMLSATAAPGTQTLVSTLPTWLPIESFLDIIRQHHVDPTAWQRWKPALETMNPTQEFALYLSSDPTKDPDGYTFTRFAVFNNQDTPLQ